MYWRHTPNADWCQFEAVSCISTTLRALVTSSLHVSFSQYTNNPIDINTLKIWAQRRRSFGFKNLVHLDPIHNNHLFLPNKVNSGFHFWQRCGLVHKLYLCEFWKSYITVTSTTHWKNKKSTPPVMYGLYRNFFIWHPVFSNAQLFLEFKIIMSLDTDLRWNYIYNLLKSKR